MANPSLLPAYYYSLCFLLIFSCACSLARQLPHQQSQFNKCQLDSINALEPDNRIESEAGVTETWNSNHPELLCAGVAVIKRTINANGLHLPSDVNFPELHFIVQGKGVLGVAIPGCAETYEEPQWAQSSQGQRQQLQDRHQKVRYLRQGDIVAIPTGTPYWTYNYGDSPLVVITLLYTTSLENQLDPIPRRFYLAGKPEEEHPETQKERQKKSPGGRKCGQKQEGNNVLSEFETQFLAEAFNLNEDLAKKLRSIDGQRNQIIEVKRGLSIITPPLEQEEGEEEGEEEEEKQGRETRERGRHGQKREEKEEEEEEQQPGTRERREWRRERRHRQGEGGEEEEVKEKETRTRRGQGKEEEEEEEEKQTRRRERREGEKGGTGQRREQEEEEEEEKQQQQKSGRQERRKHQKGSKGQPRQEEEEEEEEQQQRGGRQERRKQQKGSKGQPRQEEEEEEKEEEKQQRGGRQERRERYKGRREWRQRGEEGQEEEEQGSERNALGETVCTVKLHENIANPSRADLFNTRAGRITTVNSNTLPLLKSLQLSAELVNLYKNAIYLPHWNPKSNSVIYVTRGEGRVQVVNCQGNSVFNGKLRKGQLLVLPQNFVVAEQAGSEGLEYITFKTNDRATISTLVGPTSAISAIPAEVLANAYGLSPQGVSALKNNRNEVVLVSPAPQSQSQNAYIAMV